MKKTKLLHMDITTRITDTLNSIPKHIDLVAISKTKSLEEIMEAYNAGQRIFGENKVQEMNTKREELPSDIQWHMVGHLQTNKVKYISAFVSLIHSVDSMKLVKEINKQGVKNNRKISCLLQVKIAKEITKFGMSSKEVFDVLRASKNFKNVHIVGLMGMASLTKDYKQIEKEFKSLKELYDELKLKFNHFKVLSMGMSSDYKTAISNGSTMVRIGSQIFGSRN